MPYLGNKPADRYLSLDKQTFTTSATATYALNNPVANANEIDLFLNNVKQEPTEAYTASGNTLTLSNAITSSDAMYCVYLGKSIGTINPSDGSVGTSQILNSAVTDAKINSVASTKITGTLPIANGGTGLATLGTASQELRVNSGGTALEYYTPTVASSDYVLLATTDITSSTASLSFNGLFSSTYRNYKIIYNNVVPVTSSQFSIRYIVSGSDVTAGYYMAGAISFRESTGTGDSSLASQWNADKIFLNTGDIISTNSAYGINGEITIYNPLSTTHYKTLTGNSFVFNNGQFYLLNTEIGGQNINSTSALSGIKLFMSSGNIASGNFKLYGLK